MNDENWIDFREQQPPIAERVLVTDGGVVVIASYVHQDRENRYYWIFDDHEHAQGGFEVQYWQHLPASKQWLPQISAEIEITGSNIDEQF